MEMISLSGQFSRHSRLLDDVLLGLNVYVLASCEGFFFHSSWKHLIVVWGIIPTIGDLDPQLTKPKDTHNCCCVF